MSIDDLEELPEEKILDNCKPYINLLREVNRSTGTPKVLLRGSTQPYEDITKVTFKRRERTLNVLEHDHKIANEWFKEKFGIEARNETVFTTSDAGLANEFGRIYYFFPIGKFTTIHAENIRDFYIDVNSFKLKKYVGKLFPEIIGEFVNVDQFYDEYPDEYKEAFNAILEDANYKKNDYVNAITSGNEVMIRTKTYYMVPHTVAMQEFIQDIIMLG